MYKARHEYRYVKLKSRKLIFKINDNVDSGLMIPIIKIVSEFQKIIIKRI